MEYEYVKTDLLEKPQKYQKSKFYGIEFLNSYFASREFLIKKLNDLIEHKVTIKNNFRKNSINKNNDEINLETELTNIYVNKIQKNDLSQDHMINIFLKKFEIQKRLFDRYNSNNKKGNGDFRNLKNYILLDALCCIRYKETKNLKFLNSILKINDTLSTQILENLEKNDLILLLNSVQNEIEFIKNLFDEKGIVLK